MCNDPPLLRWAAPEGHCVALSPRQGKRIRKSVDTDDFKGVSYVLGTPQALASHVRLPDLLNDLAVGRNIGTYKKLMVQYKRAHLLILDKWLLHRLKEYEARDLLEIVEARHQMGSTIFLSQFASAGWHGKIGERTLADAILDRSVHDSYEIFIDGKDSMRKRKGLKK